MCGRTSFATSSVTIGNAVRLIFLDTASGDIGKVQFDWLEAELQDSTHIKIVLTHYPVYDGEKVLGGGWID